MITIDETTIALEPRDVGARVKVNTLSQNLLLELGGDPEGFLPGDLVTVINQGPATLTVSGTLYSVTLNDFNGLVLHPGDRVHLHLVDASTWDLEITRVPHPEPFIVSSGPTTAAFNVVFSGFSWTQDKASDIAELDNDGVVTVTQPGWYRVTVNTRFSNDTSAWLTKVAAYGTLLPEAFGTTSSLHASYASTEVGDENFAILNTLGISPAPQAPSFTDVYTLSVPQNGPPMNLTPSVFVANYFGDQDTLVASMWIMIERLGHEVPVTP